MNYPEWPIISTDSHIALKVPQKEIEARIPQHLREQLSAPALELEEQIGDKKYEVDRQSGRRHRPRASGGKVPSEASGPEDRLPFLAIDGVGAELLFGGIGLGTGKTLEAEVVRCQVNNDILHETFKDYYDRFAPGATLPIDMDIEAAIAELKRIAKLGLRPAVLNMHNDKRPYNRPDYEPFWAVANDLQVPFAFHVASGRDPRMFSNPGGAVPNYIYVTSNSTETVTLLACSGILDRFPNLRFIFSETEAGWLAWTMECMDRMYYKHQHWQTPNLAMVPSEYVKRHMLVSLLEDPVAIAARHFTGIDVLSMSTDFPHHEGTWPHTRDVVAETMADCTMEEMKKITHDNAAKFLNFKADTFIPVN
jgi:predicted TIM-barrel fold metal-dependent hydrolase